MTNTVITIGAVCGALIAFGALARGVWWMVKKIVLIADAVHELLPNSGSSMKDQMTRMEKKLDAHLADRSIHAGRTADTGTPTAYVPAPLSLIATQAPRRRGRHPGHS